MLESGRLSCPNEQTQETQDTVSRLDFQDLKLFNTLNFQFFNNHHQKLPTADLIHSTWWSTLWTVPRNKNEVVPTSDKAIP